MEASLTDAAFLIPKWKNMRADLLRQARSLVESNAEISDLTPVTILNEMVVKLDTLISSYSSDQGRWTPNR